IRRYHSDHEYDKFDSDMNSQSTQNTDTNTTQAAPAGHSAKIMVVDDDVRLRDLLRRYQTEQGFAV
ncbi:MAG: two-component system response regulator OmpR, partial [Massilia sp.]|nr:two-component system response regulator OmpR [Massilia sp.]